MTRIGRLWARGLNSRGQLGVGIAQAQVNDFLPLPGHDYQAVAVGGGCFGTELFVVRAFGTAVAVCRVRV